VAPGTYTLTASAAGYTSATQSSTVTAGATTTNNFTLTATLGTFTAIQGWVKASGANTCTANVAPTGAGHVGIFCTTNFSDNNIFSSVSGGGSWTVASGSLADDTTRHEFTECAYNLNMPANATTITGNVTGNAWNCPIAAAQWPLTTPARLRMRHALHAPRPLSRSRPTTTTSLSKAGSAMTPRRWTKATSEHLTTTPQASPIS
jgi:hypothetical protein